MSLSFKTQIRVEGLNLCRAVCELENLGFELSDIRFLDKKRITFCVKSKECAKVVAYLKKKWYNTEIIGEVGLSKIFKAFKRRAIAFSLIAVAILAAVILSGTCLEIEINAPEDLTSDIVAALEEIGVKKGCNMRSVDLDETENALCVSLPDVKYAFAEKKGSKLFITVETLSTAPQPDDLTVPRDIVASCDGVVTRILVLNGTPLVSVGDTVKKGQVLIRGQNTFADGTEETATAMGEVWAETTCSHSVRFMPTTIESTPTGNVLRRKRLKIFNYFTRYDREIDFKEYSTQTTVKKLFPLGITVEYQTVFETKTVVRENTLESCYERLKLQAYEGLKAATGSNELQEIVYSTDTVGNDTFVTAKAKIIKNVAIGG